MLIINLKYKMRCFLSSIPVYQSIPQVQIDSDRLKKLIYGNDENLPLDIEKLFHFHRMNTPERVRSSPDS